MKVIRNLETDGNICTPTCSILSMIKDNENMLFYKEHNLRHPLGICNVSESRFFNAYQDLINFLGNQQDIEKYKKDDKLFIKTKEVIESFVAYIDDIYLIYKCFYPKALVSKQITFADRWLDKAGCNEVNNFKNAIISFAKPMIKVDDFIKHNHGRIIQIRFVTPYKGSAYGFFIAGMSDENALIPNENIHPKYKGMATAFSYNRFLLELLSNFYFISYYAERSIKRILYKLFTYKTSTDYICIDSSKIIKIINELNHTLTKILFEDEYEKCSQVEFNDKTLIIKSPADKSYIKKQFENYSSVKIEMISSGDGLTSKWKVPYIGDEGADIPQKRV